MLFDDEEDDFPSDDEESVRDEAERFLEMMEQEREARVGTMEWRHETGRELFTGKRLEGQSAVEWARYWAGKDDEYQRWGSGITKILHADGDCLVTEERSAYSTRASSHVYLRSTGVDKEGNAVVTNLVCVTRENVNENFLLPKPPQEVLVPQAGKGAGLPRPLGVAGGLPVPRPAGGP